MMTSRKTTQTTKVKVRKLMEKRMMRLIQMMRRLSKSQLVNHNSLLKVILKNIIKTNSLYNNNFILQKNHPPEAKRESMMFNFYLRQSIFQIKSGFPFTQSNTYTATTTKK